MRRWKYITLGVTGAVLLTCIATLVVGVLLLTAKPGPRPDYGDELAAINESLRPSPDAPDGWPVIVDLMVQIHETMALTALPGRDGVSMPDFSRLYAPDTPLEELRELRDSAAPSHAFSVPVYMGTDDDPYAAEERIRLARDWRTLRLLENPRCRETIEQLGDCTWMNPPRRRGHQPSLLAIRQASAFLLYRLQHAWRSGDRDDVRRCLRALFALETMSARQPSVIHHIIADASWNKIQDRLRWLIVNDPPDAALSVMLLEELKRAESLPHWSVAFDATRLDALDFVNLMYSGKPGGSGRFLPVHAEMQISSGLSDEELPHLAFEERIENLRGFMAPSRSEIEAIIERLYDQLTTLGDRATRADLAMLFSQAMTSLDRVAPDHVEFDFSIFLSDSPLFETIVSLDAFVRTDLKRKKRVGELEAVVAMLLIERHRQVAGAYPDALSEADDPRMPRGPLPFWNAPLLYERVGTSNGSTGGYRLRVAPSSSPDLGVFEARVSASLPKEMTFTDWKRPIPDEELDPFSMTAEELDALAREYMSRQPTPSDTPDDP